MVEEGLYPLIIAAQVGLGWCQKRVDRQNPLLQVGLQYIGRTLWEIHHIIWLLELDPMIPYVLRDLDALSGQLQEKSRGTTFSFLGCW